MILKDYYVMLTVFEHQILMISISPVLLNNDDHPIRIQDIMVKTIGSCLKKLYMARYLSFVKNYY